MVSDDLLARTRPEHPTPAALADLAAWLGQHGGVEAAVTAATAVTGAVAQLAADPARRPVRRAARAPAPTASTSRPTRVAAGAVAVLTDPARGRPGARRPAAGRAAPRAVLGRLAAHVYGDPAAALRLVGVTGTQGKTTTTRLAEGGLRRPACPRP